jgi:hypothetical protein
MSKTVKFASGLLLTGMAAACATVVVPPAVPVVSIIGKTCDALPLRATATTLVPKRKAATYNASVVVGPGAPCVMLNGKSSNYIVFELPQSPQNHTLTVGGQKESLRAFAPSVSILDGSGSVIRSFPKDRLTNFGTTFSVQFRPAAEARYVLVQSDPELVGTVVSAFETNIVSNSVGTYTPYSGYSSYQNLRGQEGSTTRSFSHEGTVSVYIQAVTGKIGLPNEK